MNQYVNGKIEYLRKEEHEEAKDYKERITRNLLGRYFLRMAASRDQRLVGWLIEMEGDEFYKRYEVAPFDEKISVLKLLFGEDTVLTKEEFEEVHGINLREKFGLEEKQVSVKIVEEVEPIDTKRRARRIKRETKVDNTGMHRIIAIRFEHVPALVKDRRALLFKGWAIAFLAQFRGEVKRAFEDRLRREIIRLGQRVDQDAIMKARVEAFAKELQKHVKATTYEPTDLGPGAYNQLDYYPPCAYDLRITLSETGYLPHMERVQLGLILKKLGMDVNTQLRFWYEIAVDNVGMSYEQFISKAGYQIKHLYGLVGSGTDYDAPKCDTIISTMYCTFKNRDLTSLRQVILNRFEGNISKEILEQKIALIINEAHAGRYQRACSHYLSLITGYELKRPIVHPLQFFKMARDSRIAKARKKVSEKKQRSETKSEMTGSEEKTDVEDSK